MAVNNATILDRVRLSGTNEYQQRIPATTKGSIGKTVSALFDPMNREYYNQFLDILVNRIGMQILRGDQWDNPLAAFKGGKLDYGSTIQEIAPAWIKAHSYEDDTETLLKLRRPEVQAWYHSQNRRDKYAISINEEELRTAFTEEYGLNNLVTRIMQVPYNSDNYDEYQIMKQLISEYESDFTFYKQAVSGDTSEEYGKDLLTQIQAYAGILRFPSMLYNASGADIPVFAQPDELILLITPAMLAQLNVQTLANVFNLELAEIKYRTVIVDEFPIDGCDAILTTRDFFVCHDTLYQTQSFYNPETLSTTYFLHHWGVYSVSPFVPAIAFGDYETTDIDTVTYAYDKGEEYSLSGYIPTYALDYNGDVITNYLHDVFGLDANQAAWRQSELVDIANTITENKRNSIWTFPKGGIEGANFDQIAVQASEIGLLPIMQGYLKDSDSNVLNSMNSPFTNNSGYIDAEVTGLYHGVFDSGYNVTINADRSEYLNSRTYIDDNFVLHLQKSRAKNGFYKSPQGTDEGSVFIGVRFTFNTSSDAGEEFTFADTYYILLVGSAGSN